jgi:uncharacterized protein (DUF58 family)
LFALLLLAGIFFANIFLVLLSFIPLLFTVVSLNISPPRGFDISRNQDMAKAKVNDMVRLVTRVDVASGRGLVTINDPIPDRLFLEKGGNFRVFWKGRRPLKEKLDYTLHCTRGGAYEVGESRTEAFHFSGLLQTEFSRGQSGTEIVVKHASDDLRKLRDPRLSIKIPMPASSVSRINSLTTDFKEIREYVKGDAFRNINWKATVRSGGLDKNIILVNDFEREGTRRVWIFLDGGRGMASGSSIRNAFEYGLQAALGLSRFYLARDSEVGLSIYHQGIAILPDGGRRQEKQITSKLLSAEIGGDDLPLEQEVKRLGGHIAGTSPLFIIISRVRGSGIRELKNGMRQMRRISGNNSRIVLLNVGGGDEEAITDAEKLAERIAELRVRPVLRSLRSSGAYLITWNPLEQDFRELVISRLGRGSEDAS